MLCLCNNVIFLITKTWYIKYYTKYGLVNKKIHKKCDGFWSLF